MKWIFPSLFIIIAIAFFFGVVDPMYKSIGGLQKEAKAFDAALSKSRELQKVRDNLLDSYNSFSVNNLERLEKILPDNIDNVRLIMDINNIASKYGMSLKNTNIREVSEIAASGSIGGVDLDRKPYGSIILGFSVSSSYSTFIAFLGDLEKSLRLSDITSLSFIAGEKDFYQYSVELETYWLK